MDDGFSRHLRLGVLSSHDLCHLLKWRIPLIVNLETFLTQWWSFHDITLSRVRNDSHSSRLTPNLVTHGFGVGIVLFKAYSLVIPQNQCCQKLTWLAGYVHVRRCRSNQSKTERLWQSEMSCLSFNCSPVSTDDCCQARENKATPSYVLLHHGDNVTTWRQWKTPSTRKKLHDLILLSNDLDRVTSVLTHSPRLSKTRKCRQLWAQGQRNE